MPIKRKWNLPGRVLHSAAILSASLTFVISTFAQQEQGPSTKPVTDDRDKSQKNAAGDPQAGDAHEAKDRMFSVVPDYNTVTEAPNQTLPPLTVGGKFKLAAKGIIDPGEFILVGLLAGKDQALNDYPSLGQGWGPFGERYASDFADQTIGNLMTGAIFPSMLRQDPRYFRKAQGGFWHRTGYAMSRIVVTRSDSGRNEFNISEIFGNGVAAGIGDAYRPREERTLTGTAITWGTQLLVDTFTNVIEEFWPDIERKLHWKQLPF